jgi:hypothetical protein
MEYVIGLILALGTAGFAKLVGFDRDRAFYPTVVIVTASYYVLFAVMGASSHTLLVEVGFAAVFSVMAVFGFKRTAWVLVAALIAHGVFDVVRPWLIHNPGVPRYWPGFCMAFDLALGAVLGWVLIARRDAVGRAA